MTMNTPTLVNGINGGVKPKINGINGIMPITKAPSVPPIPPDDDYNVPLNGGYLEGFTIEEIINARAISDPHMFFTLPPFAHKIPLRLDSFRSGTRPTVDDLRSELPITFEGQTPLAEIVDRVIQHSYENLTEMAEVMPSFTDREKKEKIIEWAVSTRKLIIKVYAIANWARVSEDVQRAMDMHEFLGRCTNQVSQISWRLEVDAKGLIMKKRRNADLLNAIDILTTGSYQRLPKILKDVFQDPKPLTDQEVISTLSKMDDVIRYRLRFREILPPLMNHYRISDGRAWFAVPNLFEASFSVTGPEPTDFWQMLDMKFLFATEVGRKEAVTTFPVNPDPMIKQQIIADVNVQMVLNYLPPQEPAGLLQPIESPHVMDAPFVRVFNTLQLLSLHYQLNILKHQAEKLISLGWADQLKVEMVDDGLSINVSYWTKLPHKAKPNPNPTAAPTPQGGTITISVESNAAADTVEEGSRLHVNRMMAALEERLKSESADGTHKRPSDVPSRLGIVIRWKPSPLTWGINLKTEDLHSDLKFDPMNIDFRETLDTTIKCHISYILRAFQRTLLEGAQTKNVFSDPSDVEFIEDSRTGSGLRIRLCGSQCLILTIDHRRGIIIVRGSGDFTSAAQSARNSYWSGLFNADPSKIVANLLQMKYATILDTIQHQAGYLGLRSSRSISLLPSEMPKLGNRVHIALYISLAMYPGYYLAMLGAEESLRWALISVRDAPGLRGSEFKVIDDVGILEWTKIGSLSGRHAQWRDVGEEDEARHGPNPQDDQESNERMEVLDDSGASVNPDHCFTIKTEVLRELHAFCCARVSHTKVEQQLKLRGIPCTSVFGSNGAPSVPNATQPNELGGKGKQVAGEPPAVFCPTASSVPIIWIKSKDVNQQSGKKMRGEVAHENIKIQVIDWWSERRSRVVTSVKLRYVQPLSGLQDSSDKGVDKKHRPLHIHPSQRITYDPQTSIVSFISDNVETCVGEFLDEWNRVQRVVGIVQEVGKAKAKHRWADVNILAFDLRRIEFVYHSNYTASVQWVPPATGASSSGSYVFSFGTRTEPNDNPHGELGGVLSRRLENQAEQSMSIAVESLLKVLRNTLAVLSELNRIKRSNRNDVQLLIKGSAWYRLIFGMKHAVDFRVLTDGRVWVLDVARSNLFSARAAHGEVKTSAFAVFEAFDNVAKSVTMEVAKQAEGSGIWPPVIRIDGGLQCRGDVIGKVTHLLCKGLLEGI